MVYLFRGEAAVCFEPGAEFGPQPFRGLFPVLASGFPAPGILAAAFAGGQVGLRLAAQGAGQRHSRGCGAGAEFGYRKVEVEAGDEGG